MADRVVSGIGRELRYFEYKLRKKQTSKKHKKDKNGNPSGELAWSDSPSTDDFRFTPSSEEVRKAVPSNKGEEDLQIQVALAMSREEEQERSRQNQSDDLRLKMALDESKKEVEVVNTATQPSLLDLSMSAPKQAAAAQSVDMFGSKAVNDPWGGDVYATVNKPAKFDPFAPQQAVVAPVSSVSAPYSLAASDNAWGIPQNSAPAPRQDPWGGAQSFTPQAPQPNAFPVTQATNNPWGTAPATTAPAQPAFPPAQNGNAWGNPDPFLSTQPAPTFDPFSGTNAPQSQSNAFAAPVPPARSQTLDPFGASTVAAPQSQANAFGMPTAPVLAPQSQPSDPFGMNGSSSQFTAPPFDPLKDFDNLHIAASNGVHEPDPVILQNDYGSGKSVARDIFPLGMVLEPVPATAANTNIETGPPVPAPRKKETQSSFLGENSSLVNLDSGWKTYQVPYCTKPLGTQTHNPFQQTGPSKSLNEMMVTKQPGFS